MSSKPSFSIIVIAREGSAHLLPFTLASILEQDCPHFETIVVEEGTLGGEYPPGVRRVVSERKSTFAMKNEATSVAQGAYLHFLSPGEFYLSRHSLTFLAQFIEENFYPDLVSSGTIVKHSFSAPEILFESMSPKRLKRGSIVPTLQPFFFRKEVLVGLGGFRTFYREQSGFDLLCRFFRAPSLRKAFFKRVLTDYEYRPTSAKKIIRSFAETLVILFVHFGLSSALFAWLAKNQLRLFAWCWGGIKGAFRKRRPSEIF
ncbi:MAG: hypothetical protein ACHQT8_01175 [Chlamydiales bacterium]